VCAWRALFAISELGVNFPAPAANMFYLTEAFGPTWGFMTG